MTSQFVPTPVNMVVQIRNIIEGYSMGPLRALAQEPVQNSKDEKNGPTVRVEFQLHRRVSPDGGEYHLLTVTDSGTGGLQGPVLTQNQLEARGYKLQEGENWAAFEGQGFTEKSGGELGSRGQGKSASLYHSDPTSLLDDGRERALMLYDTLLDSGEYRLGVRYANPSDTIQSPPLYGDDAKDAVQNQYQVGTELTVSLGLTPLDKQGARIIVPYLSNSAVEAIRCGELHRWLQRCWWRAIQTKELEVTVTDEAGDTQTIEVPDWWKGEPWLAGTLGSNEYRSILVEDGLLIKRIVLHYDSELKADEIHGHNSQFEGVQLLRGRQWIETLDIRDMVPPEYRAGFRGFAEFDRLLEAKLKASEKPQHDSFNGTFRYVSETRQKIRQKVEEFAQGQGWAKATQTGNASRRDREHAADFLTTFTTPKAPKTDGNKKKGAKIDPTLIYDWKCQLAAQLPDSTTTRVDWGDFIENVTATVQVNPMPESRWAKLSLELKDEAAPEPVVIQVTELELKDGEQDEQLGDFQIIKGKAYSGQLRCPSPGVYGLRAKLTHLGQVVASSTRRIHVAVDPPKPPEARPYAVSVAVQNLSNPSQKRVNSGEEILVQINAKNRTTEKVSLELYASLGDLLVCDGTVVEIPGTPAGDTPQVREGCVEHIFIYESMPAIPPGRAVELEPGRHSIRADLTLEDQNESQAHASCPIFFEMSPGGQNPDLPFELEAIEEGGSYPMWVLTEDSNGQSTLKYHVRHPIYRELPSQSKNGNKLGGRRSFVTEVCAAGLLEWALNPLKTGDTSRIDILKESAADGDGDGLREQYREKLERLEGDYSKLREEEPSRYDHLKRQTIADMLHIFQGAV